MQCCVQACFLLLFSFVQKHSLLHFCILSVSWSKLCSSCHRQHIILHTDAHNNVQSQGEWKENSNGMHEADFQYCMAPEKSTHFTTSRLLADRD
uniref:Secreted protein n=1 Tax=Hippocampus comes TaxID=109280 RepID=A0A3Q3DAQ6_HIPCM